MTNMKELEKEVKRRKNLLIESYLQNHEGGRIDDVSLFVLDTQSRVGILLEFIDQELSDRQNQEKLSSFN